MPASLWPLESRPYASSRSRRPRMSRSPVTVPGEGAGRGPGGAGGRGACTPGCSKFPRPDSCPVPCGDVTGQARLRRKHCVCRQLSAGHQRPTGARGPGRRGPPRNALLLCSQWCGLAGSLPGRRGATRAPAVSRAGPQQRPALLWGALAVRTRPVPEAAAGAEPPAQPGTDSHPRLLRCRQRGDPGDCGETLTRGIECPGQREDSKPRRLEARESQVTGVTCGARTGAQAACGAGAGSRQPGRHTGATAPPTPTPAGVLVLVLLPPADVGHLPRTERAKAPHTPAQGGTGRWDVCVFQSA